VSSFHTAVVFTAVGACIKDRIVSGSMHTWMVLAATNGASTLDVPSIPASASFEIEGFGAVGGTRMNLLSPRPPVAKRSTLEGKDPTSTVTKDGTNNNNNTARSRRLSAIAAAREGTGCKFYGVLKLSAEAEERMMMMNASNNDNSTSQLVPVKPVAAVSKDNKRAPNFFVSAFAKSV
jgi:hypothetical protein